ncbi:hypothetical protein Y10_31820 [Neptunitalea sp. Y10]|uniref:Uncharacterized protein n=1 Tax=Neptunitalea lumnitzerae TaxID=2965509 RepID=A0ABQ5MN74_9FLAO|nr:hypothetical protein Y10_31820 [Neptunitalea sp. Y10]
MISAAITPGTQPHKVSKKVITTDPHPLSNTANGGQTMAKSTLKHPIRLIFQFFD